MFPTMMFRLPMNHGLKAPASNPQANKNNANNAKDSGQDSPLPLHGLRRRSRLRTKGWLSFLRTLRTQGSNSNQPGTDRGATYEQYLHIRPEQLEQLAANALDVQCQSCGATVTFTPPEVARQCDFCGVQLVAQAKSADPILAPEGVLPFCISQLAGKRRPAPMAQLEMVRAECAQAVCPARRNSRHLHPLLDLRYQYNELLHRRAR